jgi:hypothetical protein
MHPHIFPQTACVGGVGEGVMQTNAEGRTVFRCYIPVAKFIAKEEDDPQSQSKYNSQSVSPYMTIHFFYIVSHTNADCVNLTSILSHL